jgi:hypothetical protein
MFCVVKSWVILARGADDDIAEKADHVFLDAVFGHDSVQKAACQPLPLA